LTHGDRFRQLDDQKLAKFLNETGLCPPTCTETRWRCETCTTAYSLDMWYQYLISEVENETEI